MSAIVLAAGRGRRLQSLTLTRPRPLLPVAGRPMLAHVLDALGSHWIQDIVVVVGYLGEQIEPYLATRKLKTYDRARMSCGGPHGKQHPRVPPSPSPRVPDPHIDRRQVFRPSPCGLT